VGGDQLAITVNDVAEIVEQHLVSGKVVERLAWLDRDKLRQTIAENWAKAQASALADAPRLKRREVFVACFRGSCSHHDHEPRARCGAKCE
jgi:hypothetical protein